MKNTRKFTQITARLLPAFALMVFLGSLAVMSLGCNAKFKNPFAKKSSPPARPETSDKNLADFQGYFLSVKIDGVQTRELRIVDNEQIWNAGDCSSAPAVMFEVDQEKLAPIKNATISINPLIGGQPDLEDIWLYTGKDEMVPGKEISLDSFDHFVDGKVFTGLKKLPAGKYRLALQVNGYDTWDRQLINIEVK
jgi:hypothetical protein